MKRYLICNWKCHKDEQAVAKWLERFAENYTVSEKIEIVICPSFLHIPFLKTRVKELCLEQVTLAAQDVSPFPRGNYSGAVSADMIKPFAQMAVVGHSERREYFHETNHDATNKVAELADTGMTPILCLDDSYLHAQLSAIADIEYSQIIAAYCPTYALNSRKAETVENIKKAIADIRIFLPKAPIIYGGGISPENAKQYWQIDGLSGLFVGSAGLDADSFLEILKICS